MILRRSLIYVFFLFVVACSDRSKSTKTGNNNGDSATIVENFVKADDQLRYQEADQAFKLPTANTYFFGKIYKRATGALTSDTVILKQDSQTGFYLLHAPTSTRLKFFLPDKSAVWLNSESSIAFPGDMSLDRHVNVTGEACFNIQKSSRPFVIKMKGSRIDVSEGKINVTNYPDSGVQSMTIESGNAVMRTDVDSAKFTGPFCIKSNMGHLSRMTDCDPDISLSWTQGFLSIDPNEKWEQFLARIKRWYGIKFIYHGSNDSPLDGKLPASASIKQFLDVMRANNIDHSFEIENGELRIVLTQKQ